jgi:hypothetical protein
MIYYMPPTADETENEKLYNLLIELKKPGKDSYPLISEGDVFDHSSGHIITIFRSNITGVQLQEYKRDAHNEAHMEKIRCTLLKHIYKLYEERNEKLMAWIKDMGNVIGPNFLNLFDRIEINIEKYCDGILTPQSTPGSSPGNSPPRKENNSDDDGKAAAYGGAPASELELYNSPKKTPRTENFGWPLELSDSPPASQIDLELLSGKFSPNPDNESPPNPDDEGHRRKKAKTSINLFGDDDDSGGGGKAGPSEGGRRKRRTQRRKTKKKRVRSKSRTKHKTKRSKRRHRGKKATKRKSSRRSRK